MKRSMLLKMMLYVLMTCCILTSCERDADVKLPAHKPKLVLHGYVETGHPFTLALGRTIGYAEKEVPDSAAMISNAVVLLYENGVFRDTLRYDPNEERYVSSATAIAGNSYAVVVKANGFEQVEASASAPVAIPNIAVQHIRNARFSASGGALDDVVFSFADPAATANYYLVEINRAQPTSNPSIDPFISFCMYTHDPVVEHHQDNLNPFESGSCIENTEVLFNDKTFNGAVKQLRLSGDSWSLQTFTHNNITYRPFLKKYNVSREFYDYIKAGISLRSLDDNPFAQLPVIRGNVRNGHGLFTIFSATVDTLR